MGKQKIKERYSYGYAKEKNKVFKKKESQFKMPLNGGKLYIIRFDGKGMTKGFKIKHKAINESFFATMKLTLENFARKYSQTIFAYSFSDEISLLFRAEKDVSKSFSRGEKLLSLMSGQLALEFLKAAQKVGLDCKGQDWLFDARLIELERDDVVAYFKARQAYAIDKFLSQCKGEYGLDYRLITSKEIITALKEKGVEYEDLLPAHKFGLMYAKDSLIDSFEFVGNEEKLVELCFGKWHRYKKAA